MLRVEARERSLLRRDSRRALLLLLSWLRLPWRLNGAALLVELREERVSTMKVEKREEKNEPGSPPRSAAASIAPETPAPSAQSGSSDACTFTNARGDQCFCSPQKWRKRKNSGTSNALRLLQLPLHRRPLLLRNLRPRSSASLRRLQRVRKHLNLLVQGAGLRDLRHVLLEEREGDAALFACCAAGRSGGWDRLSGRRVNGSAGEEGLLWLLRRRLLSGRWRLLRRSLRLLLLLLFDLIRDCAELFGRLFERGQRMSLFSRKKGKRRRTNCPDRNNCSTAAIFTVPPTLGSP